MAVSKFVLTPELQALTDKYNTLKLHHNDFSGEQYPMPAAEFEKEFPGTLGHGFDDRNDPKFAFRPAITTVIANEEDRPKYWKKNKVTIEYAYRKNLIENDDMESYPYFEEDVMMGLGGNTGADDTIAYVRHSLRIREDHQRSMRLPTK